MALSIAFAVDGYYPLLHTFTQEEGQDVTYTSCTNCDAEAIGYITTGHCKRSPEEETPMDTCTTQPDCNCFNCFTNLDQEEANADAYQNHVFETETFPSLMENSAPMNLNECITSNCTNPVPVPGTMCPTCKLWHRAYIASDVSDYINWQEYVELMQAELSKEADEHAIMEEEYRRKAAAEDAAYMRACARAEAK